ncbi:MAG: ribosome-associated translation inhibitor RaiA [Erysipelotrichia bacterium]|jgi:putative sigma-54 modulation protein|nr:ribosome-associated translation inhibitor RaiA [Bacilli bacterium]NLB49443.1 ribosome-associated translation inhibitor RaiA [Erysipelotrichia bacterium]
MKYQIVGKNIQVTKGIENALIKKLSRMDKYFVIDDKTTCRAVVSSQKVGAKVEITIFIPTMILRAEVENQDLYAAVDLAIDKLEGQMRKIKMRMDRSNGGKLSLGKSILFDEIEDEKTENKKKDVIVRAKSYYLTPMSIDEAILRMDALGHNFFVYLDEEDDRISVVYVRNDGGYGVIQAENEIR